MILDFEPMVLRETRNNKRLIIYGAGNNGQQISRGLSAAGCIDYCFADKEKSGEYIEGHLIIDPLDLNPITDVVIIGTGKFCESVYKFLVEEKGFTTENVFSGMKLARKGVIGDGLGINDYEHGIKKYFYSLEGNVYLPSLDFVITERCSLKCKYCSNLMQYYGHPYNCDADLAATSLHRVLDIVEEIGELRIIGGEPFMNQKFLVESLKQFSESKKINRIAIVSNGTILPADETIVELSGNYKAYIQFSNYGQLSRALEETASICKKNNIKYNIITDNSDWLDYGEMRSYGHEIEKCQKLYDMCDSRHFCNTLFKGKFYLCPRQAHGVNLGYFNDIEEEYVDFSEDIDNPDKVKYRLLNLLARQKFISTCDWCNYLADKKVPKAEQVR